MGLLALRQGGCEAGDEVFMSVVQQVLMGCPLVGKPQKADVGFNH